jgi:hypothetical protein
MDRLAEAVMTAPSGRQPAASAAAEPIHARLTMPPQELFEEQYRK